MPGRKLNIAACSHLQGVSPGAVREALAMLESEGLVVSEPQRGYRVSPISLDDMVQLVKARIDIEKLCLAEAIRHGDIEWESSIVAAFHRLSRVTQLDAADNKHLSPEWTAAHADFHKAIVAGCPNPWLLRMQTMLYQQSERYRQLSVPMAPVERDIHSEHKAILDALLRRDIEAVQKLITSHLQTTADMLLTSPVFANAIRTT
jgi:DNA-binding GntR family transcriptional regulator